MSAPAEPNFPGDAFWTKQRKIIALIKNSDYAPEIKTRMMIEVIADSLSQLHVRIDSLESSLSDLHSHLTQFE